MHRRYDSANVPIELLRTLVAIADHGSFTRAAETLRLTQSAVSAQMKRLQQIVGGELFGRTAGCHGLGLTERGQAVATVARRIIGMNDQLLLQSGVRPFAPVLRVGVPTVLEGELLARLIRGCESGAAGGRRVQFCCDTSVDLLKSLSGGYLDLAILFDARLAAEQTAAAWDERFAWVCAPDFVLSPGAPIPLVAWSQNRSERIASGALDAAGLAYAPAFTSSDFSACLTAVRARLGFLAMPERAVPADLKIARDYYLPPLPPRPAGLYLREGIEKDRLKALIHTILSLLGEREPRPVERPLRSGFAPPPAA